MTLRIGDRVRLETDELMYRTTPGGELRRTSGTRTCTRTPAVHSGIVGTVMSAPDHCGDVQVYWDASGADPNWVAPDCVSLIEEDDRVDARAAAEVTAAKLDQLAGIAARLLFGACHGAMQTRLHAMSDTALKAELIQRLRDGETT